MGRGRCCTPGRCARRPSPERGAAASSRAGRKQTRSSSLRYTTPHSSRLLALNATPERSGESEVRDSLAWYTQQEAQAPGPEEEDTQHLPRGCREDEGDVSTRGKGSRHPPAIISGGGHTEKAGLGWRLCYHLTSEIEKSHSTCIY